MSLLSRLNDDMKAAMKAKDKESLQVIRMIKSSIQNEQIKEGHDLTEEEELTVLSREMKQRRDSLHEFEEAGRDDLAEKVKSEIVIVENICRNNFPMKKFDNLFKKQSLKLVLHQ